MESDERSDRQLSIAAGLGENYVQQFKKDSKNTGAQAVIKLCEALGLSPVYVFCGIEITPEDEETIRMLSELPESDKDYFLDYLRLKHSSASIPE